MHTWQFACRPGPPGPLERFAARSRPGAILMNASGKVNASR